MMNEPHALLFLPRLRLQNTNAVSSPLTWGFPAPSAFTGFVHALELRTRLEFDLQFDGVGIVCHQFEPQVFRPPGRFAHVLRLTRNPVDKDGSTAAIVEEGRAHLDVTLIVGVRGGSLWDGTAPGGIANRVRQIAGGMRLAGGSILPGIGNQSSAAFLESWPEDEEGSRESSRRLRRRLLPGFAVVERQDLLESHRLELTSTEREASALESLLDYSRLNLDPNLDETAQTPTARWSARHKPGWLVPVPLGYAAISPLHEPGSVQNARDTSTPFRFVESVLGLGQWISPHRINDLRKLLWYHDADPERGIYRCRNFFSSTESNA